MGSPLVWIIGDLSGLPASSLVSRWPLLFRTPTLVPFELCCGSAVSTEACGFGSTMAEPGIPESGPSSACPILANLPHFTPCPFYGLLANSGNHAI